MAARHAAARMLRGMQGRAVVQGSFAACGGVATAGGNAAWPRVECPSVAFSSPAAGFHSTVACEARRRMRGTVVSDKAQKSIVVAVERLYKHPVVGKYVKTRSKFMAHDELDQYKVLLLPE